MGDTPVHRIVVAGEVTRPGWKRVTFRCVVPDCLDGQLEGSPAAAADAVVALFAERHPGQGRPEVLGLADDGKARP